MTNSKSTKKALITSVVAILTCVAMLIGTTFAWFTDAKKTGGNTVKSGTLSVDIVKEDGTTSLVNEELNFVNADGSSDILWEPGATFKTPAFRIKSNGTLALKYKLSLNDVTGDTDLLDVIKFTVVNDEGTEVDLDTFEGHLTPSANLSGNLYIKGTMDERAGNIYQGKTLTGLGITVVATQDTVEKDSKDNTYDENATYPVSVPVSVNAEDLSSTLNTIEENSTITVKGTVTEPLTIDKAVTINDLESTGPVTIKVDGVKLDNANITSSNTSTPAITVDKSVHDISITDSVIKANTTSAGTHAAVVLPNSGKVVFTGNTVTNDYNGIEFGLDVPVSDGTVIANNKFDVGNNGISIYQVADGATITIKDNEFTGKQGNYIPIRLSNSNNMSGTFVIENNKIDTDKSWKNSIVMLEDYSKADGLQDFTKYTLKFKNNTVGSDVTYTIVYDDQDGIISTNQPIVEK